MRIRFLNLLLIGSIVSSVIMVSCGDNSSPSGVKSNNPTINSGTFTDSRDNKTYKWVKIGEQVWMAENLAYTGSGSGIHITDGNKWANNSAYDAWCYYKNDENHGNTYGVLYQWEAAKKACPAGWHLPTDKEWLQLEDYLKNNAYSYDRIVGNDGIAKSLATDYGWTISDIQGAVGNSDSREYRNKTGFSALPGGYRTKKGYFFYLGNFGHWWTATESDNHDAISRGIDYHFAVVTHPSSNKSFGYSVRCVKD